MNETCRSCRFWINDEHMSQMCRLNPQYVAHGPQDWCGQWAESEAAARARVQEANLRFYESQKAELERREHAQRLAEAQKAEQAEIRMGASGNAPIPAATPEPVSPTAAPEGKDTGKAEIAAPEPSQKKMPARRKR